MTRKLLSTGLCVAAAFLIASCVSHDLGETVIIPDCEEDPVSYASDIVPIVNATCAVGSCHNGSMGPDLDWTNAEKFSAKATEAARRTQLPTSDPEHMPKNGAMLSVTDLQKIACWAEQGAPIN